ncbi:MAG: DUF1275 family protein [Rhizomicrobium sp.]
MVSLSASRTQAIEMRIPILLSINGGYVDTTSFLALHGLFAAHVTGNFVTLGAALVLGTSGAVAKLLALPMFCAVIVAAHLLSFPLRRNGIAVLRTMLLLKLILLLVAAVLAVRLGPFADGDSMSALLTGMTLVAAMAIQNAAHRIHLPHAPPSTLMTGTTTQIMIDVADLLHGENPGDRAVARTRMGRMTASVAAFAFGCGAAALAFAFLREWSFFVPTVFALLAYLFAPRADSPAG